MLATKLQDAAQSRRFDSCRRLLSAVLRLLIFPPTHQAHSESLDGSGAKKNSANFSMAHEITFGARNDKQIDIKTEIIYFLWVPQILLLRRLAALRHRSSVTLRERGRQTSQTSKHKYMAGRAESGAEIGENFFRFAAANAQRKRRRKVFVISAWKRKRDEEEGRCKEPAIKHPQPLPSINMEIENENLLHHGMWLARLLLSWEFWWDGENRLETLKGLNCVLMLSIMTFQVSEISG